MKKLHDQIVDAGTPYDTLVLNEVAGNLAWLTERKGNHVCLTLQTNSDAITVYQGHRPFCSVSGFASLAQIPWYINTGLKRLKVRMYARVSSTEQEAKGATDLAGDTFVQFRAGFLANEAEATLVAYPRGITSSSPRWAWYEYEYELGDWPGGGVAPPYDVLTIGFKSFLVGNYALTPNDFDGQLTGDFLAEPYLPYRVKHSGGTPYANVGPPSPNAGTTHSNEVTATVVGQWDGQFRFMAALDHVMKNRTQDTIMHVWPPLSALGRGNDGGLDEASANGLTRAWKWQASYLQVRAIEIEEVYV